MVIASTSFIVIGLTAFFVQVSQTLASPEMRSALVDKAKRDHLRRAEGNSPSAEYPHSLPKLKHLTDSPGVKLAYRLAIQRGETTPLVLSALFAASWNAMVAVLAVIAVQKHASGSPDWFLTALLLPFGTVSYFCVRWFFRLFRRQTGVGPTAIEISDLPLLPGKSYAVYLCQYGRATLTNLRISMVAIEEAIYEQGTDIRTQREEVARLGVEFNTAPEGPLVADPEQPIELDCTLSLPDDIMHSFQGQHNALTWKIVVEGNAKKWPSFCRAFPVVVYPPSAV